MVIKLYWRAWRGPLPIIALGLLNQDGPHIGLFLNIIYIINVPVFSNFKLFELDSCELY